MRDEHLPAGSPQSRSYRPIIVVGVAPGLPDAVLCEAARLARDVGAELLCAHVDLGRYVTAEHPDGSIESESIDPDLPADRPDDIFDPALAAHIDQLLADSGVLWTGRELAGDPARALAHVAEAVGARLIVVGTRHTGVREGIKRFFEGSVAMHLAHRQHRPVLVVPLSPITDGRPLPWE